MKKHILQYLGDRRDADYGAVSAMTIDEILDEINRDHSSQWTDYNKNDWREGLAEWTYYVPHKVMRGNAYIVRAQAEVMTLKGSFSVQIYESGGVLIQDRATAIVNAQRYTLKKALEVAKSLNRSGFAKRNGYTFRVYPAIDPLTPRH